MKKIILSILAATPLLMVAQQVGTINDAPQSIHQKPISEVRSNEKSGALIWSEDFSNGWPAGWITIDSSGICPWVYSTDGSWGNFNANNGASADPAMLSTTGSDGFLICDQDSANHANYGQPSGSTYQYLASYFEIPPINCSTNSSVILEFEQKFRYNNSVPMFVMVSTDSTNWTAYDVSDGQANNTVSADPDIVTLNLSTIAANEAKVHLRIGWSARVYFWMIDDMVLREGNDNDLSNLSGNWETGNELMEYHQTPLSQLTPISFTGSYTNIGNNDIPNVSQEVTVEFGGSAVHSASSTTATSLIATIDSVTIPGTYTPASGVGTYDLTWTVSSSDSTDLNAGDNSTARDLIVSNTMYARDNGVATGSIGNFSSNTGQTFKIGNLFETFGAEDMCQVGVGLSSSTGNDGQVIYAEVHRWNSTSGEFEMVDVTDDYTVTTSDLGTVVNLQLFSPIEVVAGELYLVVAGHYGGTTDARFLLCQSVEEQTVYGFRADGSLVYLSTPRAPMVRMVFDGCDVNVTENSITDVQSFPNPVADVATIQFNLNEGSNVQLEITDMEGRTVLSNNYGTRTSGFNQITLDVSNLAAGMYQYRLIAGKDVHAERIVVTK